MNIAPRCLITAPVSERHKKVCIEWLKHLDSLTYPYFDVLLIENTLNTDRYFKYLQKKKVHGKLINVIRHEWDIKKMHPLQMLAHAREISRKYAVDNKYDFMFTLDDDIFIPKNGIQRLISYNKDCVGFYVHVFPKKFRKPCVFKSGDIIMGQGCEFYSFVEINYYKKYVKRLRNKELTKEDKYLYSFLIKDKIHPNLFKAFGVNLGCLMIRKNVFESVPFRTHPTFLYGEDQWFFAEVNDKKFEMWCDSDVRAIHKNTSWSDMMEKNRRRFGMHVIIGDENAKEVKVIDWRRR